MKTEGRTSDDPQCGESRQRVRNVRRKSQLFFLGGERAAAQERLGERDQALRGRVATIEPVDRFFGLFRQTIRSVPHAPYFSFWRLFEIRIRFLIPYFNFSLLFEIRIRFLFQFPAAF